MDKLPEQRSDWDSPNAAWPLFAAIILGLLGVFNVVEGLLTLFNDRYGGQISGAFFFFNLTGWGWLHLLLGLALMAVAAAMFMGFDWAPSIAVGLAGATAIFAMIYVNIIPTWSWINVALAVLLIYVLVIKGRDMLGVMPRPQAVNNRAGAANDKGDEGTSSDGDIEP
ncbi:MAG TPA: hypothetical protein VFC19_26075 [Candidatus Limnocylindrales bacterium]|nr:hypothetical protein [Candidatus Limnocylindrales bacterium]